MLETLRVQVALGGVEGLSMRRVIISCRSMFKIRSLANRFQRLAIFYRCNFRNMGLSRMTLSP